MNNEIFFRMNNEIFFSIIDDEYKFQEEIKKHFNSVLKFYNKSYRCKYNNMGVKCYKHKVYGYKNDSRMYCRNHKLPGMVNLVSKKCIVSNCNKTAFFNYPGYKKEYCNIHKKSNMINIINKIS